MITHIRHVGIVVSDLEKSLKFYRDLLGFTVHKQAEETGSYLDQMLALEGVRVTTVKMKAPDGNLIELLNFASHRRSHRSRETCEVGITHFAVTVPDIDDAYQKLRAAGVVFNAPPQRSPDGYAKVTYCKDPDGSFVELVEVL
ncbi:MAG: VOC family protein [Bdellovibrionota bacterium]